MQNGVSGVVGGVTCTGANVLTEAKLRDDNFIKFQLDCAREVGPCDEIGEKIKSKHLLPEDLIRHRSILLHLLRPSSSFT